MGEHRTVFVCRGTGCISAGGDAVYEALSAELARQGVTDTTVDFSGCHGFCEQGPNVVVEPESVFYTHVKAGDSAEIVESHLVRGEPVERLFYRDPATGQAIASYPEIAFYKGQERVILRHCGHINPERIEDYREQGGYEALKKALLESTTQGVIDEIGKAGLRGRGGAGFPTGRKWQACHDEQGEEKYVVCNADEGDPGAFMDRSILEASPHSVVEGLTIAGYAVGASVGYVYVRAEYPLAVERLRAAIGQAEETGMLGADIFGSGFDFSIRVMEGAGAFVCGEETALLASLESRRGMPRPRPPYPAQSGLWGKPTIINNVKTLASVCQIIERGADWFAGIGTEKSPGTTVFALTGKIANSGLVEVPLGTPLSTIVFEIGGGIPNGKKLKAVQTGGPSGGCIPAPLINTPVDYESLSAIGSIVGSGGMIVMDDDSCMVDLARYFLSFTQLESCGKCIPCRWGTKQMLDILEDIVAGRGREGDVELLVELGAAVKNGSLCGLGGTAANPVLSTIRYFREEYDEHIREHRCRAGACADLYSARCSNACPANVQVPGYVSLIGEGRLDEALRLHREHNPLASICGRVCFHPCESKCVRATLDQPVSIRGLKRFMTEQETRIQVPAVRANAENATRKVAVIGAGPGGLTCAYFLARLGYRPVIFEKEADPGGMLVQAIPAYRLPRRELLREVAMIESLGVTIETGKELGRDVTLSGLKDEGYEIVFLGVGAPQGQRLGVPGEEGPGVTDALAFLREYNLNGNPAVGKNVVVVGGGNSAIDAARTARRLGAESVTILYRRERLQMPAWAEEVDAACEEDVDIMPLTAPRSIVRNGDGNVTSIVCQRMALGGYDSSGRRRPVPSDLPDVTVACDHIIVAVGQALDTRTILDGLPLAVENGWIKVDRVTGSTTVPWIFAGGDAVTGPASVVEAIGAGERAAVAIDRYLTGAEHAFWRPDAVLDTYFDPGAPPVDTPRATTAHLDAAARSCSFAEVDLPWDREVAIGEAKRCLRCDFGKGAQGAALAVTDREAEEMPCLS
jgi:NADH-quinone oxidoreductase subunit F